jgi:ABC-2 type transport system permease protein
MMRAFKAELLKLKGARMHLWAALAVVGYGVISATLLPALKDPKMLARISAAGGSFGQAATGGLYKINWTNVLRTVPQGIAGSWGFLLFGVITAYLFGREYSEGTAKNMLTLPVRREYFVLAKMAILALWVLLLTLLSLAVAIVAGLFMNLGPLTWTLVWSSLGMSLQVSLLLYLTMSFVAWLAMLGKGYLPPMIFTAAMMTVGMLFVVRAWSRWLPWSMPVLLTGASWMPVPPAQLVPASWIVAVAVFVVRFALSLRQIDRADNTQ